MTCRVELLGPNDRERYEGVIAGLPNHDHVTFYHTWEWGTLMEQECRKLVRIAVLDGAETIAVGQVGLHQDRRLPFVRWWYSPRGLAMDYSDPARVEAAYGALRDFFRGKSRASHLKVDPNVVQGDPAEAALDRLNTTKAPIFTQVERCWVAEIQPTQEQQFTWLRANGMKSEVKRRTRKAHDIGITFRVSTSDADLEQFLRMMHELDERKGGIGIHRDGHYRRQFAAMSPKGYELLFIAERDGEIGAINMMAIYGAEASWLHGASNDAMKKEAPSTMLHLDTMQWLAENRPEVRFYNFWGVISDENREKGDHPRHGYSEFKRNFGGYKVEYLRARHFVYNPLIHKLSWEADAYRTRASQND